MSLALALESLHAVKRVFTTYLADRHHVGLHQAELPPSDVSAFARVSVVAYWPSTSAWELTSCMKLGYFGEIVYFPAAFFTKMSILCLIARVFRPHRKAVLFARSLIGLMALYYLPVLFIKVFRCIPIQKTWNPMIDGRCTGTEYDILYADCVMSLFTDLAILILPIPLVWQLQTSRKRKVRITLVFGGGILCVYLSENRGWSGCVQYADGLQSLCGGHCSICCPQYTRSRR